MQNKTRLKIRQTVTDKGRCQCEERLTECRAGTAHSPGFALLSPWSSAIVPLDLDVENLLVTAFGGKTGGA